MCDIFSFCFFDWGHFWFSGPPASAAILGASGACAHDRWLAIDRSSFILGPGLSHLYPWIYRWWSKCLVCVKCCSVLYIEECIEEKGAGWWIHPFWYTKNKQPSTWSIRIVPEKFKKIAPKRWTSWVVDFLRVRSLESQPKWTGRLGNLTASEISDHPQLGTNMDKTYRLLSGMIIMYQYLSIITILLESHEISWNQPAA